LPGFRADILTFVKSFDLFVMSSLFEGLGTSLLDAMALSKATIASDTGGIPEVVLHGDTGLLVPPRDSRELAAAISTLLKDPARREKMGRAGLERVKRIFSADQMIEKTLAVYRKQAGAHHDPSAGTSPAADTLRPPARG
ncbi:MAG TPA: glycosyltransferase, partial [Vicinamibacterales bacterium]|nr:glycosyltransferase [Vicinamibacterales bacterium]